MAKKISSQQVAFFRYELEKGNFKRKKIALQDLCALYRKGLFLSSDDIDNIETIVNGLVLQGDQDLKVVRWCLNSLAQFGRNRKSSFYVEAALRKYVGNPEIEAAGVAALSHMRRGNVEDIEALSGIDPIIWKLAALQNTDPAKIDLRGLIIDVNSASDDVLRLALITVGLNKDIEHLFHPKHTNGVFVRELGQHSDDIVQQYSVWAVIENRRLGFDDLGIPVEILSSLKSNVQAKIYQLIAERDPDARRRLSITTQGAFEAPADAREGLAKGVKSHFYDGLEGVTIDWFKEEENLTVRGHLAEHFARFADACPIYEELVTQIAESEPTLNERLLLGAEGKPLYSKLKAAERINLLDMMGNAFDIGKEIRSRFISDAVRSRRRVLMFGSNPLETTQLRIDEERREIENRIQMVRSARVFIDIEHAFETRTKDILPKLLGSNADILHFSGHGEIDGLIFEHDDGVCRKIEGALLAGHLSKAGTSIKCLILNACFSDSLASFLLPHVDFMIGCTSSISDEAAIAFSGAFYAAMASGKSYNDCFELATNDVAISQSKSEAKKFVIRSRSTLDLPI